MTQPRETLVHPRDELMRTMERIYRYRMTTTSGGNLSVREENGDLWITPARVDKGSLRREDIVRVDRAGNVEGRHRPSSELPFHQAIYAARPDVRAVVHAHPTALVAFSICRQFPNTRLLPQAWHVCGEVGFAPYALPGSAALGESIARTFAAGHDCVVLENHGVVTAGTNLQQAFERFETLEFTAKIVIKARQLGEVHYLGDELERAWITPAEGTRPRGAVTSHERELRKQLCEMVERSYQQRLMISTAGAFSARLDDATFLITPRRVDRRALQLDDIVLVERGQAEAGKTPSRTFRNHQAIYERCTDVAAVVNAYPVNATAFSVTGAELDTRTIPESYVFLRDVRRLPFGVQLGDGQRVAELASTRNPIVIFENDGVQACGTSVLDAFDRLEVLESTCEAMINSRPLGPMSLMPSHVIDDLRRAFFSE